MCNFLKPKIECHRLEAGKFGSQIMSTRTRILNVFHVQSELMHWLEALVNVPANKKTERTVPSFYTEHKAKQSTASRFKRTKPYTIIIPLLRDKGRHHTWLRNQAYHRLFTYRRKNYSIYTHGQLNCHNKEHNKYMSLETPKVPSWWRQLVQKHLNSTGNATTWHVHNLEDFTLQHCHLLSIHQRDKQEKTSVGHEEPFHGPSTYSKKKKDALLLGSYPSLFLLELLWVSSSLSI